MPDYFKKNVRVRASQEQSQDPITSRQGQGQTTSRPRQLRSIL